MMNTLWALGQSDMKINCTMWFPLLQQGHLIGRERLRCNSLEGVIPEMTGPVVAMRKIRYQLPISLHVKDKNLTRVTLVFLPFANPRSPLWTPGPLCCPASTPGHLNQEPLPCCPPDGQQLPLLSMSLPSIMSHPPVHEVPRVTPQPGLWVLFILIYTHFLLTEFLTFYQTLQLTSSLCWFSECPSLLLENEFLQDRDLTCSLNISIPSTYNSSQHIVKAWVTPWRH